MGTGTAFKFLAAGRLPCKGGSGAWPEPGVWAPKIGRLVPCERGYHVCGPRQLLDWLGPELWRVEWRGESIDAGDKLVVGEARLVERVEAWDDRAARLFACDCAERVVRLTGPDKRAVSAIATARRFAGGEASGEELAAARAAAGAAARDAARAAAGAAARAAAGDAARAAAVAAAGAAAWAAAWAAARDAARAGTWIAARDAARNAERSWQTARLLGPLGLAGATDD